MRNLRKNRVRVVRLQLSVTKLIELIAERHHYCREFWSINDFILRNWGHVLTPFLDTCLGIGKVWIGRWINGNWSAEELPMRIVADEETIEYD